MKLTKKLIPALGMLVLSACMLVTSTFAWFAMNEDVTAKGMTVTAKADQVYLQIVNDEDDFDDATAQTEADATNSGYDEDAEALTYRPITVASALSGDKKTLTALTATGDGVKYLASNSIKWYTSTSSDPAESKTGNDYSEVTVDTDENNLAPYCLINTFYVRLNPGTNITSTTSNLKCTVNATFTDDLGKTVSVLVVCGEYAQLWRQVPVTGEGGTTTYKWQSTGDALASGGFANTGTDNDEGVAVKVYIFFDGEHTNCKTNNVDASNYDVEVNFSVAGQN